MSHRARSRAGGLVNLPSLYSGTTVGEQWRGPVEERQWPDFCFFASKNALIAAWGSPVV
jgi:hypothetical protein